jgi:hypothetical protein
MILIRIYKKDNYIKIIKFKKDKSVEVKLIKTKELPKDLLLNNNHVFLHRGYKTVLLSDTMAESINPLDLKSRYPIEKFKTAIETKVINDVFNTIRSEKLDIYKILLFANIFIGIVILYFMVIK